MTRFPLTIAFLKAIEDTARHYGAKRISRIWLRLGTGVLFNENTSAYFRYILMGTAAKDAEIHILYENEARRCRCCRLVFAGEKNTACPLCGGYSDTISLDKRFIIDAMEIER